MSEDPIKRCVLLVLYQSQQDQATELAIGPAPAGEAPIRYKVEGTWHDWKSPGAALGPELVAEVQRLAGFPDGPFPKEGNIEVGFSENRLRWRACRASEDSDCILTPVGG